MLVSDLAKRAYIQRERDRFARERDEERMRAGLVISKLHRDWTDAGGFAFDGAEIEWLMMSRVKIDDIVLYLHECPGPLDEWYLVMQCNNCSREAISGLPVCDLADIGRYLSLCQKSILCDHCRRTGARR